MTVGDLVQTPDWRTEGVRIVKPSELNLNTPQTPGMTRAAAINFAKAGASKLWAGAVDAQPKKRVRNSGMVCIGTYARIEEK